MPKRSADDPRRRGPRHAAALEYEPGSRAPQVVAAGAGVIAERIVATARELGIPVRSDPALATALAALELGAEVPEPLYAAVAEALAWAYRLDMRAAGDERAGRTG